MSASDPAKDQTSLPLRADPASGALIGTFLLAACLAGPVGLVLALIGWIVIDTFRRRQPRDAGSLSQGEPIDDEFAGRFRELENNILRDDRTRGSD